MKVPLELNLRRMALLKYALSLWDKGNTPFKLKQFYYPYERRGKMRYLDELVDEVVKRIDPALPAFIYHECVKLVKDVAYKKCDWSHYLRRSKIFRDQSRRQIYDKYCKDIYWTHYGTIDEPKILKYSWMKIPNIDPIKTFIMASCFCSEELIDESWEKISKMPLSSTYKKFCGRTELHLAAYWYKVKQNKVEDFINDIYIKYRYLLSYDVNRSLEMNMLYLAVVKGFVPAVKYFWNKLNHQEKYNNVENYFICSLDRYYLMSEDAVIEYYKRDSYAEITLLFVSFLDEELKRKISSKIFDIFEISDRKNHAVKTILRIGIELWPRQEYFKSLFNEFQNFFDEAVLKFLLHRIVDCDHYNFFQGFVLQIWNKIPSSESKILFVNDIVGEMLEKWDISVLKCILNEEILAMKNSNILLKIHIKLISLIRENKIIKLAEFINNILIPEHWTEGVQETVKSLYEFFLRSDVDSAVELLDGFLKEEVDSLKCKINPEVLCYYFVIKNQFEVADKFLKWKFEDNEKIREFKSTFENNDFIVNQIHNLWKNFRGNLEISKNNSTKLLIWLLGEEKRVSVFKITHILPKLVQVHELDFDFWLKESRYNSLLDLIDDGNHFFVLEELIDWSFFETKGAEEFKKNIFKDCIDSLFVFFVKEGRFEEISKICKWKFESEDEMFKFMRKNLLWDIELIISKYSCPNSMFERKPTKENLTIKFKNFIQFLMGPFKDFDVLKEKLRDWPEHSRRHFEQIDSDVIITDDWHSDWSENIIGPTYCDVQNFELFMSLLNEVEDEIKLV